MTDVVPNDNASEGEPTVTLGVTLALPGRTPINLTEDEARSVFHLLGDALREGHTPIPEVH